MWTLASSASAYLQHMREPLYNAARARLEQLDHEMVDSTTVSLLQLAQAWLLLTNYEFRYLGSHRAWFTAGRAFRIVPLARLHQVDSFSVTSLAPDTWTDMEEKRRTFWLAYCLDRFANFSNAGHLTLYEDIVSHLAT